MRLLRVVVGVTFVAHGLDKLVDLSSAEQFFASLDIPAPGLAAPFVAVTETIGGALLIIGLGAPLLLGGASVAIALAGAGRFSLDASFELPQRFLQRVSGVIGTPRST
jgi:putative oxidoreductase